MLDHGSLDTIRALKQLRGQGQSEELQLQPFGTPKSERLLCQNGWIFTPSSSEVI